jgi:tetratricopeptide (TPR) repeat protein
LKDADLEQVALSLYTRAGRFEEIGDIPPSVRHRIVKYAVQNRDLKLAADMARDLTRTYAGQSPDEWNLVRARLAIYSGDLAAGRKLLDQLIRPRKTLTDDLADRIMQLVFDLQNMEQHEQALELFRLIQERVQSESIRREILFWIAESLKGKGEYSLAAEYFLQSANHGGNMQDMWGQTSRYHAADALAEGGMLTDALGIYKDLLRIVTDPGQIMSLERKIQDLWLREQGLEGG